jgi:uncharacterized protein YkwD
VAPPEEPPIPEEQENKLLATPTFEEQVMEILNQERWSNGQLPPLKHVDLLDSSAEGHSVNMAQRNFFMHCDPDLSGSQNEFHERMAAAGYFLSSGAENIAAGYANPVTVMVGWMASIGHRNNILSAGSREVGIGFFVDGSDSGNIRQAPPAGGCSVETSNNGPYVNYWTQNFGSRNGVYPVVINREAFETTSLNVSLYVYGPGNATQMRFSNDGTNWSAWMPFTTTTTWTLSGGNGVKTVFSQVQASGTVSASDTIQLSGQIEDLLFANGFENGTTTSWQ